QAARLVLRVSENHEDRPDEPRIFAAPAEGKAGGGRAGPGVRSERGRVRARLLRHESRADQDRHLADRGFLQKLLQRCALPSTWRPGGTFNRFKQKSWRSFASLPMNFQVAIHVIR